MWLRRGFSHPVQRRLQSQHPRSHPRQTLGLPVDARLRRVVDYCHPGQLSQPAHAALLPASQLHLPIANHSSPWTAHDRHRSPREPPRPRHWAAPARQPTTRSTLLCSTAPNRRRQSQPAESRRSRRTAACAPSCHRGTAASPAGICVDRTCTPDAAIENEILYRDAVYCTWVGIPTRSSVMGSARSPGANSQYVCCQYRRNS